ncbi:Fasciclin-like arabinogalactan protein 17 [Ancistrocladus abbreviatus]
MADFSELVEKALLLPTLEDALGRHNLTIFAPVNRALDRDLDAEFKHFLLQPRNLRSLQSLILHHIVPTRVSSTQWRSQITESTRRRHHLRFSLNERRRLMVEGVEMIHEDAVVRPDGVIHGIQKLLVPQPVQQEFNRRRNLRLISAVLPEGAPEVDPRNHRLKKDTAAAVPVSSSPAISVFEAMAPGPSLAPAPAPGPDGPHGHFDGESQVRDFILTLLHYGGYNEMADILVNLTSLATEMGRLVSEGYVLTVLAPNDEAMAKLTAEQLAEPGSPEQIVYYHVIPEYQTEESMYNAVRRFEKVKYDTLRLPYMVVAEEADGSVKFGDGDGAAYLFDPDIYTDGRISVQGIDGVLFPKTEERKAVGAGKKAVANPRRGKLTQLSCFIGYCFITILSQ